MPVIGRGMCYYTDRAGSLGSCGMLLQNAERRISSFALLCPRTALYKAFDRSGHACAILHTICYLLSGKGPRFGGALCRIGAKEKTAPKCGLVLYQSARKCYCRVIARTDRTKDTAATNATARRKGVIVCILFLYPFLRYLSAYSTALRRVSAFMSATHGTNTSLPHPVHIAAVRLYTIVTPLSSKQSTDSSSLYGDTRPQTAQNTGSNGLISLMLSCII